MLPTSGRPPVHQIHCGRPCVSVPEARGRPLHALAASAATGHLPFSPPSLSAKFLSLPHGSML